MPEIELPRALQLGDGSDASATVYIGGGGNVFVVYGILLSLLAHDRILGWTARFAALS
jgi:hypothetical protein